MRTMLQWTIPVEKGNAIDRRDEPIFEGELFRRGSRIGGHRSTFGCRDSAKEPRA